MQGAKTLLVTGGTGSFGNTILRHFLAKDEFDEIIVFSRDEKKQDDMRHHYQDTKLKFEIGDVRDAGRVNQVLRGVDYVFHAAALKQVPTSEKNPIEAVKTNILGTENVIDACVHNAVENLTVLSTDKAVMPVNAMGMSKALAEKLAMARSVSQKITKINCTRYGNVLASRGSVLPLFVSQILNNGEVTITDGEMTRFVMSLDESVDLVSHAFSQNTTGKLYVKKAPAADIYTLFAAVKEILGVPCKYRNIGARHGEKKHETLVSAEEMLRAEDQGEFYCINTDSRTLNYANYTSSEVLMSDVTWEDYSSSNTERLDLTATINLLKNNREFNNILREYGF